MNHLDIAVFNEDGSPRDVPAEDLALLTQEQTTRLAILQRVARDEIATTADHNASIKAVHDAVKARDAIVIERDRVIPKRTHLDELRAMGMHHGG